MAIVERDLAACDLDFRIDEFSGFGAPCGTTLSCNALLFADDVVFGRVGECGLALVRQNAKILSVCRAAFTQFNLVINMSPGKTELTTHFVRQASAIKAGLAEAGRTNGSKRPVVVMDDGALLTVSSTYVYLGRWTSPALAHLKEARTRKGSALSAVKELSTVMKSSRVPRPLKVSACSAYALPRLTYCIGAIGSWSTKEQQVLCRGYYLMLQAAASDVMVATQAR
eukprot:225123-Amphidinium_carterae.1